MKEMRRSTVEKGKFIALEGIDGSGKSSQIGPLVKRLEGLGVPCREIGRASCRERV